MRKKYAIKGEPDFHNLSDKSVKDLFNDIQQLIFVYKGCDSEKTDVLETIWKDLSLESTERLVKEAEKVFDSPETYGEPAHVMRKVPKLRKSPAKKFK